MKIKKITLSIIIIIDNINDPILIECNSFEKIFLSINGKIKKPTKIIIGSFTNNHNGTYEEGRFELSCTPQK